MEKNVRIPSQCCAEKVFSIWSKGKAVFRHFQVSEKGRYLTWGAVASFARLLIFNDWNRAGCLRMIMCGTFQPPNEGLDESRPMHPGFETAQKVSRPNPRNSSGDSAVNTTLHLRSVFGLADIFQKYLYEPSTITKGALFIVQISFD